MITKQAPERKGLENITVPIQLSKLNSAIAKGDWERVESLATATKLFEVGKHAIDEAVLNHKSFTLLDNICRYSSNTRLSKYAVDKLVESQTSNESLYPWEVNLEIIAEVTQNKATAKYILDKLAEAGKWHNFERSGFRTPILEVAKYAIDKAAEAGKWESVKFICDRVFIVDAHHYADQKLKQHEKGLI